MGKQLIASSAPCTEALSCWKMKSSLYSTWWAETVVTASCYN